MGVFLFTILCFSKQVVMECKEPFYKKTNDALRRLNVKNVFCFIEPSPIVNLLKNVYLFIQIVNTMQNVLNQIVPSLIWVEEFQYCLQNQLHHQHHLLVVNCALISLLVRQWNVPSIVQNTAGWTLSVQDLAAHFSIPPLLCHHDMPWNGFNLKGFREKIK